MKICNRCGDEKELDDFYKNSRMSDGRTLTCKDCLYVPKIGRHKDVKARAERRAEILKEQRETYGDVGMPTEADRFWNRVNKTSTCWLWTGYIDKAGRARFALAITGVTVYAYRWVWVQTKGPIPEGMFVCHKCDNPACVNPDHLFLGDAQDNVNDMIKKGRGGWQKKKA